MQLDENERARLSLLVMDILQSWHLNDREQLALLGMEDEKPRQLTRYRHGGALPEDNEILDRAKHILGIQESLHMVFPLNHNMPAFWLSHRNRQLKGIPLNIMLEEGVNGMQRVWQILDCTVGWTDH